MISGMLTAIQDFIRDSFLEDGQDLETIAVGRFELWLTYTPKIILVGVVRGTAPVTLKEVYRRALDRIEDSLRVEIDNFKGEVSAFERSKPLLEACLLGQDPDRVKTVRFWPLVAVAVVVLLPLTQFFYTRAQWRRYFDVLKQQPGVVITNIERGGSQWIVSGFKDPAAPDPARLLEGQHLKQSDVRFVWQPFLSVNTPFAARRELEAAADRIRKRIIRFDSGHSKLSPLAGLQIDDMSGVIGDLAHTRPDTRIEVIGHADEFAGAQANEKLSLDRANQVVEALAGQGVRREILVPVGAGNGRPFRTGSGDRDRSANRSVSFVVTIP